MQISILNGIYTDNTSNFRTSYPRNLVPVPKSQGISQGYLRQAEGIKLFASGLGADRGSIQWRDECYRVQGTKLIKVLANKTIVTIGDVGTGGAVTFEYSFDHLAISSGGRLYLYDGTTLAQNVDPDLGVVLDFVWIDSQFITTDGENLVATEIGDPFSVNPFKYGSSEIDPDPINGVHELRNEVVAVNRHTIEFFRNIPTGAVDEFPFRRINGAQIQRGAIGTHASTIYNEQVAFVGGGRGEPPSVYLGANGGTRKIASREIEEILKGYSEATLSTMLIEARENDAHSWLYVHLPDKTLVFDGAASAEMSQRVWFTLSAGILNESRYPARSFTWCYDMWLSGNPITGDIGEMVNDVSTHYGNETRWEFGVSVLYNEGRGVIVHEQELVCLTGSALLGANPVVSLEQSTDGLTWSSPLTAPAGVQGDRNVQIEWRRLGHFKQWQIQRFYGSSDAHIAIARLEARVEGLAN